MTSVVQDPNDNGFDFDEYQKAVETAVSIAEERALAVMFLMKADGFRYGKFMTELENAKSRGRDEYPKTVVDAYSQLMDWKNVSYRPMETSRVSQREGVNFANVGDGEENSSLTTVGKRGDRRRDKSEITCFKCQEKGHY